jgi:UDP-N-acetylglucosamine--N-acetylmuramyl-(pentapeptide) pyrophosphoryl-undecaprenol N-acetylglucosamine transferase
VHQTGNQDHQWLTTEYQKYPQLKVELKTFIEDMVSLYRQSHLFICRAGSMINEIIAMGKASILIPIAISSGDHQRENARIMAEAGAAIMIEEKALTSNGLFTTVRELILNPEKLVEMGVQARSLYQGDSACQIVNAIQSFFKISLDR